MKLRLNMRILEPGEHSDGRKKTCILGLTDSMKMRDELMRGRRRLESRQMKR
jgi:hypothetical protein